MSSYALQVLSIELTAHCESVEAGAWRFDRALLVADRYRLGLHPLYKPNSELARSLYTEIARVSKGMIRHKAKHSLQSMVADEDVDANAADLPTEWGERVLAVMQCMESVDDVPPPSPDDLILRQDAPHHIAGHYTNFAQQVRENAPFTPVALVGTDVQNVHDAYVKDATRELIRSVLMKADELRDSSAAHSSWSCLRCCMPPNPIEKFTDELVNCPDMAAYREHAQRVIKSLVAHPVGDPVCSEIELLEAVLLVIQSMPSAENLLVTLAAQLASAVEHGVVVCSTGKKARMVSVLETTSDGPRMVSLHVLRQEIMHMASCIREKVLSEHDEAAREAYESGGMELVGEMRQLYLKDLNRHYAAILDRELLAVFRQEAETYF